MFSAGGWACRHCTGRETGRMGKRAAGLLGGGKEGAKAGLDVLEAQGDEVVHARDA